ncbi:MAG: hypothetical protein ABI411_00640 [Tahibacter sp.]
MENAALRFWQRWLFGVTLLTIGFGLFLMLAPRPTREGFSWLFYASPQHIDTLGAEAVNYITFLHGALGAAILGWGIVLMLVTLGPFRRGTREGWLAIAASLIGWFVPDVMVSLWFGFWQNVVLDGVFAVLYAAPLIGTWRIHRNVAPV